MVIKDTDALARLRTEMKDHASARVEIGVFADRDGRTDPESNASIGLDHEFGKFTGKYPIPERSFLRMPIITKLPEMIMNAGKEGWRRSILEKGIIHTLKFIGILAEGAVQAAFASGGFGRWPKLSAYTIREKGSSAILIDKGELRAAINSRVVEGNP